MSFKLIVVALLAVSASIVAAQAPTPPKKVLTVKTCASDTCACTAAGEMKKFSAGICKKEGTKFLRFDVCDASADTKLISFSSMDDCSTPTTDTISKDCTPMEYIKATCAMDKVQLMTKCPKDCASGCTDVTFDAATDCKQYGDLELYFKPSKVECTDGDASFEFNLFTDAACSQAAPTASLTLTKDTCTHFIHKKAACDTSASTATIHSMCYGATGQECTTCKDIVVPWNQYKTEGSKTYFIDKCVADADVVFKTFTTAPEITTIPHECTAGTTDPAVYTMGTCADDKTVNTDPNQGGGGGSKKMLKVATGCTDNTCGTGCTDKMYPSGECVPAVGGSGALKADCGATPTLKKYADMDKCTQDTDGTPEALPASTCTQDGSTYKQAMCVDEKQPDETTPDTMPGGPGGYDGPIITVNASCSDDNCVTCQTLVYLANGSCFEEMPMPPPGKAPAVAGSRRQQRPQEQTPAMKYYKADCGNLTVTTYTDKDCSTEEKKVTYTSTCDKTNKAIAECTIPTAASTNPPVEPPVDGPVAGPGEGKDTTSSNNTTGEEGLYAPCVHSLGALAVALLVTVFLY